MWVLHNVVRGAQDTTTTTHARPPQGRNPAWRGDIAFAAQNYQNGLSARLALEEKRHGGGLAPLLP